MSIKTTIKEIQTKLNTKGYGLEIDGILGPFTARAINEYIKGNSENQEKPQTEHFSLEEWRCKDGSLPPQSMWQPLQELMNRLELLRKELGENPIYILSGYRSPKYNAKLYEKSHSTGGGGIAKNSPHMRCTAADIRIKGVSIQDIYNTANEVFKEGGVGIYHTSNFVHVDLDYENKRPARWKQS